MPIPPRICPSLRYLILILLFSALSNPIALAQVGREYGNPSRPLMLTHLAEKHQRMLGRGYIPHHNPFAVILCFKRACRNEARKNKSLHSISFNKFRKKIRRNARKGYYKKAPVDTTLLKKKPPVKKPPVKVTPKIDTTSTIAKVEVNRPVLKADSLIVLSEFLFETNSATLKGDQFSSLDSLMDFLIEHPSLIVKISGHTDNTGREAHNQTLSTNRAKVVAEYIIGNGVSENRVTFIGFGSTKPIAPNNTEQGRRKNRRVELLMHDKRD